MAGARGFAARSPPAAPTGWRDHRDELVDVEAQELDLRGPDERRGVGRDRAGVTGPAVVVRRRHEVAATGDPVVVQVIAESASGPFHA